LAKRAIVYHNHYAASNYTTSGTASLLTGTFPWTHRALQPDNMVAPRFETRNFFTVFEDYFRVAYSHNLWVDTLLRQMRRGLDLRIPREELLLRSYDDAIQALFARDEDIASVSWTREMRIGQEGYTYSLFLSHIYRALQDKAIPDDLRHLFPRGLPTTGSDNGFLLEQAIDWTGNLLRTLREPFMGYFHFFPPHAPYRTSLEFFNAFKEDGFDPPDKPPDWSSARKVPNLLKHRTEYDEFILYVDREFGRLHDALEASGLLETTWVVLTSDHGELFERALLGHNNAALYQPLVRIPLLIFEPGRATGMDITAPTSAVDVLPTLAYVTGHALPDWTEGIVLPPYGPSNADPNRGVYALRASENGQFAPLTSASTMLVKGRHKLLYFFGYPKLGTEALVKLFDIQADPEELVDLSSSKPEIAAELLGELKSKLREVDQPYL
jgi:arylsulfatase A-like enzyme